MTLILHPERDIGEEAVAEYNSYALPGRILVLTVVVSADRNEVWFGRPVETPALARNMSRLAGERRLKGVRHQIW